MKSLNKIVEAACNGKIRISIFNATDTDTYHATRAAADADTNSAVFSGTRTADIGFEFPLETLGELHV